MVLLTIVGSKAPYAVRSSVHGVCIGRYYPFLSVSYSAIDTPSLNPSHTSAGSFEDLAAGETSHALPHRASSAKQPLYLSTSARVGLLSLSLFNLTALSLSSRASDQHSSLTIYKCQD